MIGFAIWRLAAQIYLILKGHSSDFSDTFDPRINNEFAAAAFRLNCFVVIFMYIVFLSFLYFMSRFGHSLVPATLLSMVEGKSNRRPKQISLKEVFLAKAQHCPPSMIYHRL